LQNVTKFAPQPVVLPRRGGGDHHIADLVDRGAQTRQLDDVGAVAIEDQDGPGVDQNPGARDRPEGDGPGRAVPVDLDLPVGRTVHLVGPAGMRAGQLDDHAAQGLASLSSRRDVVPVSATSAFVGQPGNSQSRDRPGR
jgi:hypothetical protein